MLRNARLAVVAALLALAAFATPVHAADTAPLFASTWTSSSTTYQAVPTKGQIKVSIDLKVTNQTSDFTESYPCTDYYWDPYYYVMVPYTSTCTRTTRYYVNTTTIFVEAGARSLKATTSARAVKLRKESSSTSEIRVYTLTFPRIFNGQTRKIHISYLLKAGAPRSSSPVRMNGAYLNFWGIAQPTDDASVRMIVPSGFETSTWGGTVRASKSGSRRIYASGSIGDPAKFFVGVTGTNPGGYKVESLTSASGRELRLEGWPGDGAWMEAVRSQVVTSIPRLEALIGQPIPGSGPITLREVAGGSFGDAYIGAFDSKEMVATISEDYGQAGTVAHELSHSWFNPALFASTWMSEGYAQWAERAIGSNPEPCIAPTTSFGSKAVKLADWTYASPRATKAELEAVATEYAASCALVSDIAAKIGSDAMRRVLAVLSTADGAYPGTHDASIGAAADWRQWLDAVDEVGMAAAGLDSTTTVADMLVSNGAATAGDLMGRGEAREALVDLRERVRTVWEIPAAVYEPLATWDFAGAEKSIDELNAIIADANAVAVKLPDVATIDSPLRQRVAAASRLMDLVQVHQTADQQLALSGAVADAIDRAAADHGPIESLGLVDVDTSEFTTEAVHNLERLDFAAAERAIALLDQKLGDATAVGFLRLGGGLAGLSLSLGVVFMLRRRRRPRPTEVEVEPVQIGDQNAA